MLILDDYSSHYLYEFECYCRENNIVIFYIFFHLFYLFQLFDIGCFNMLKQSYNKEVENFIRSYINYITKPDFFVCFYITFFAIFGEKNVQIDFRGVGFVLFNPDVIISKLDIKLYIPILIGSFSAEIDSWVVKIL